MPHPHPPVPVDRLVAHLGHAGLVPFVLLGLLSWLVNEAALTYVALMLVAYAALVVSFLGGIHWGAAWVLGQTRQPQDETAAVLQRQHLYWGIAPSLLAWPGVLMPAHAALPWLGVVLLVCYGVDRKLYPTAGLSAWLTLRFRLSVVAALSCFVAAGAV